MVTRPANCPANARSEASISRSGADAPVTTTRRSAFGCHFSAWSIVPVRSYSTGMPTTSAGSGCFSFTNAKSTPMNTTGTDGKKFRPVVEQEAQCSVPRCNDDIRRLGSVLFTKEGDDRLHIVLAGKTRRIEEFGADDGVSSLLERT